MIQKVSAFLATLYKNLNKISNHAYIPSLKLVELYLNEEDEYIAIIQKTNKNLTFSAKPEEILANDEIVNQFAPKDIRTLTYLGYLGMNSPKYKILAKRLSEEHDKMIFAIQKKGDEQIMVKTADEIIKTKEILNNLKPCDAQTIAYTVASESILGEKKEKKRIADNLQT